jgi:hypothetical protein
MPAPAVVQKNFNWFFVAPRGVLFMAKPHRSLKKANHGARPANSKARKAKRKHIRT